MANKDNKLEWVHSFMAGVEPFLRSPAFKECKIPLTNARTAFNRSLGEFALLGILYHTKKMSFFQANQAKAVWEKAPVDMACEKSMAIVGFGDIGSECARQAKGAFDMKIYAVKRNPDNVPEHQKAWADSFHSFADLPEILPKVDFVLSVLPYTDETANYFDAEKFKLMKDTAVFMNIGRGTTVVEADLEAALEQKIIGGAALDVYAKEPLTPESKLWKMNNVLMFPHAADYTKDIAELSWRVFEKNLLCYQESKEYLTPVNKEAGY